MQPSISVVVPTYREVENLPLLVERLRAVRDEHDLDLELLVVDDDSRDGTVELVDRLALDWVRLLVRTSDRGLSQAVLAGCRASRRDVLVVMDADLSHPPEKIPEMLRALDAGADAVVGSRFAAGGSVDDDWGVLRRLNSGIATLLARPLTALRDPMSGYFALRRATFAAGAAFDPIGYKIGLELILKCGCRRVAEVPIHFTDRRYGESKLTFREQLRYLQHLRRLYIFKYGTLAHLAQFLFVGATGLVVNLALLTILLGVGAPETLSIALAIAVSMLWNFALNRRFSFSYARSQAIVPQLLGFVGACSIGAIINFFVTAGLWELFAYKQIAATIGVAAGTAVNFVASRYLGFRARRA